MLDHDPRPVHSPLTTHHSESPPTRVTSPSPSTFKVHLSPLPTTGYGPPPPPPRFHTRNVNRVLLWSLIARVRECLTRLVPALLPDSGLASSQPEPQPEPEPQAQPSTSTRLLSGYLGLSPLSTVALLVPVLGLSFSPSPSVGPSSLALSRVLPPLPRLCLCLSSHLGKRHAWIRPTRNKRTCASVAPAVSVLPSTSLPKLLLYLKTSGALPPRLFGSTVRLLLCLSWYRVHVWIHCHSPSFVPEYIHTGIPQLTPGLLLPCSSSRHSSPDPDYPDPVRVRRKI